MHLSCNLYDMNTLKQESNEVAITVESFDYSQGSMADIDLLMSAV